MDFSERLLTLRKSLDLTQELVRERKRRLCNFPTNHLSLYLPAM